MPLPNRVDPFGQIHAVSDRGNWMGNRGCIHRPDRTLKSRQWQVERWITCKLQHKGWHRNVMSPGQYTELFFLDEATSLAAGHRPCKMCRCEDYLQFLAAFNRGNPEQVCRTVGELDRILHRERLGPKPLLSRWEDLPFGAMFQAEGSAYLWWQGEVLEWSFGGYQLTSSINSKELFLLTSNSICETLRAGYVPQVNW